MLGQKSNQVNNFAYLCWFGRRPAVVARFFSPLLSVWHLAAGQKELHPRAFRTRSFFPYLFVIPSNNFSKVQHMLLCPVYVEMLIGTAVNDKVERQKQEGKKKCKECYWSRPPFPLLIPEFNGPAHTTVTLTDGWLNYLWIPKIHWLSLYNFFFIIYTGRDTAEV